jgi:LPS O-antigen subunit length determinant protein (WzzB/FepE family)
MSDPTNQEIKDLILALDKRIDNLGQKVEVQLTEIKGEIKRVEEKLEAKIDSVESRLEAKIDGVKETLEAKIDGVKEALEAKIDGLDKRLSNEEIM